MKIQIFIYGVILILPIIECGQFGNKNLSFADTNLLTDPNFIQTDYSGNSAVAAETGIVASPNGGELYKNFCNDEISDNERCITSEKLARQMMDDALKLYRISQKYWRSGEPDTAIKILDQAYSTILSINTSGNGSLTQQKDNMRFTISKRIVEIYASREIVMNGVQNEIQVILNKQVQYEINLYTKGKLRNHFINSYKRSGKYRQMMVDMLVEKNLPQELSWLPLIESGFKPKALSKSRALGLWQFIPSTGYKFGLLRNRNIDERMDLIKSTQAAISYLSELHNHFGDWHTVLAAYNCGEKRVLRAIREQKINYLDCFWDLYTYLPQETARYVPKFLATLHIVKNLKEYGMDQISIDSPLEFEFLTVTKKMPLKNFAKISKIDIKILEELNPELKRNIIPSEMYPLKIPVGNKQILLANIDQILRINPASVNFLKHRVQSGDTLSLIARRYRTSVANIKLANNLHNANHIVTGNSLKIPQK